MSLRARMGITAGVAVAIAVVAVAIAAYIGNRSELYNQIDQSLTTLAKPYTLAAAGGFPGGGPGGAPRAGADAGAAVSQLFERSGAGESPFSTAPLAASGDCEGGLGINGPGGGAFGGATGFVQLLGSDGRVCRSSGETSRIPTTPEALAVARSGHGQFFTDMTAEGQHIRVLVLGLRQDGALMLAWPLAAVDRNLRSQLLLLAVIAAIGIGLAALIGFLVARTAVAPIARFTRQAERIATNPERVERERLEVSGSDELARLASTFNTTLDALERAIGAQRNLVADASHELRTPIASLRANLQLMRDEHLLPAEDREALRTDMIEELDELTRLVGDVVELARGSKAVGESGALRLDQIVGEALERGRRRGPQLRFEAALEPTLVRGEGERIARAITNLLDNAAKWSPPGGLIEVKLEAGVLSVRDHGPGFHEEDLPFVFDRFHRARDARSKPGSGLGLAIVRQAAEAHGGFVEAGNAEGGGALIRIAFGAPLELSDDLPDDLADGLRDDRAGTPGGAHNASEPLETGQSAGVLHE